MSKEFQRVLVPIDFRQVAVKPGAKPGEGVQTIAGQELELSPATEATVRLAASVVGDGGTIRLVHATPSLAYTGMYGGPEGAWLPPTTIAQMDKHAIAFSMAALTELGERLATGVKVECEARPGPANEIILGQAEEFGADLIVLGTSGHGRAKRWLLGSTADRIIRQAPCPVLVVPG